jgi:uncharacterized membrane protein
MSRWLKQRSTSQYVLCIGGITFLAALAASAIAQAMWHGHVDISVILATSIGCTLGISIVALWQRVNQSHSR